ncbi:MULTISPECIES: GIY-YIG nuclease family protein [Bacillaceae]|uniref:GIY-YIG nuclease family protein n=1 Tax=Evansella alkalicola TaxID=745819 RepID=A0ABS6JTR8_9BACI|nr:MULTISPECIES: GIY-YIG nuclease family protein [Bacillaceae]MBU9721978.1 GIY-YIG nuclease family protein [Bacillus alkalicola]
MKHGNGEHFVYIIRCNDETYYTGYTTDIEKRINQHEAGKGAKYTRGRSPLSLVYEESFQTKGEALKREYEIKQLSRQEKEAIISEGGEK